MPTDKAVQFRWTKGEVDPKLLARSDADFYYSSAYEMTNWWVISQGGFTRRPGLEYVATTRNAISPFTLTTAMLTAPNVSGFKTGSPSPADNVIDGNLSTFMTTTTAPGTTDDYVLISIDLGSLKDVAFIDFEKLFFTSGSATTTEFEVEKSDNGSTWTALYSGTKPNQYTLLLDQRERYYRFAVDDNVRYLRLIRNGTENMGSQQIRLSDVKVWTDDGAAVDPTTVKDRLTSFEFNDEQVYLLLWTDQNLAIYSPSTNTILANVASPYTTSQLRDIKYAQKDDLGVFCHKDVGPYELKRQEQDYAWQFTQITFTNIPKYPFDQEFTSPAVTLTPSATEGTVTLTASGAAFAGDSTDIGKFVYGNNGWAEIVASTSTTVVTANVHVKFFNTTAIASGRWDLYTGYEDLWSSTRGYPRDVTFHLNRLVLGGFKGAPSVIAASTVVDFYNFKQTTSDDDGFYQELNTDKADVIYHLNSHNDLEIYTNSSEYVSKSSDSFTPLDFKYQRQSGNGSLEYVAPQEYQEGGTFYIQNNGAALLEFVFNDVENTYKDNRVDLYSPHFMVNPQDATLRGSTADYQANYWLQVNDNGNLIATAILKSQEITGASENETDGDFKHVVAFGNDYIYCIVERVIDGSTVRYLEQMTFDRITDACTYYAAGNANIDGIQYATGSITPSAPNGGTAANANDGDDTTYLTTTTNISTTDDYVALSFDLGSAQDIDYVTLTNVSLTSGSSTEFQIEYSSDNFASDITAPPDTISLSTTETDYTIVIGANKRYVRLIRNGTTDLGTAKLKIAEMSVYLDKDVTISGLDHLEGESVYAIIDNSTYGPYTVASGSIDVTVEPETDVEIGLNYIPVMITNPVEDPNVGPLMGNTKSIYEINTYLYDTRHILINGYSPFTQTLSTSSSSTSIDKAPELHTGRFRMTGFLGWDELGQVTVTQSYPARATMLNLAVYFNYGR